MAKRIYLDHNASSPLRPEARDAMLRVMDMPGNPSSIHAEGRALKGEIERARRSVAKLVGAEANQVFFTSGATEAANWALDDWFGRNAIGLVAVSATEHACMTDPARPDPAIGMQVPVDANGLADASVWTRVLSDWDTQHDKPLAVLQLANSETGVVQDVMDVATLSRTAGGLSVCDLTQGCGRLDIRRDDLRTDYCLLSGHKIGGPTGIGALVARDPNALPDPLIRGGGQERRQRAGTENVVGIAGFGAAAEAALRDLDDMPRIRRMRDRLEAGLVDLSAKWGAILHIFGQEAERLPNTSCFAVEGVSAQTALMSLDLDGFAVSSGSACSSGKVGPSHVLKAMGVADAVAACAIRVSLGWTNEEDDIAAFLAAYERILARCFKRAA